MNMPSEMHSFEGAVYDHCFAVAVEKDVINEETCHRASGAISTWNVLGGLPVTLRPVCPADSTLLDKLVQRLSPKRRYDRFEGTLNGLSATTLTKMAGVDQVDQVALVVTAILEGREIALAEARYAVDGTGSGAEFAIVVADEWQGLGIGYRAMQSLLEIAKARGLHWLHGSFCSDNSAMLSLMHRCGFSCTADRNNEAIMRVEKCVAANAPARKVGPPSFSVMKWVAANLVPDFI